MKKLVRVSQILLGIVFIFSGFVKAIDPLGTKYKLIDYFSFLHLNFLVNFSFLLAIILISTEFLLGVMFLFNIFPRMTLGLATAILIVFTPLTFYLAIKNPILDCGCFGDAIHLTNWQTFGKNLIFDIIIVYLWLNYRNLHSSSKNWKQWLTLLTSILIILLFEAYNFMFLPIIDMRPYRMGVNIKAELRAQNNNIQYRSVLIYKNTRTGRIKEFDEDNAPWQDTNWVWQDTKTIVIKKGNHHGIHDFYFFDAQHQDITDSLLTTSKPLLLIIAPNLRNSNIQGLKKAVIFAHKFTRKYYPRAYLATSSTAEEIKALNKILINNNLEIITADETMLRTVIRANPGIVIMQEGKILKKCSFRQNLNKCLYLDTK